MAAWHTYQGVLAAHGTPLTDEERLVLLRTREEASWRIREEFQAVIMSKPMHQTVAQELRTAMLSIPDFFNALQHHDYDDPEVICTIGTSFKFECVILFVIDRFRTRFLMSDFELSCLIVIAHHNGENDPLPDHDLLDLSARFTTLNDLRDEIAYVLPLLSTVPLAWMLGFVGVVGR